MNKHNVNNEAEQTSAVITKADAAIEEDAVEEVEDEEGEEAVLRRAAIFSKYLDPS